MPNAETHRATFSPVPRISVSRLVLIAVVLFSAAAFAALTPVSLLNATAVAVTYAAIGVVMSRRRAHAPEAASDAWDLLAVVIIFAFVFVAAVLWVKGGRTIFTRDVGESHAIYETAYNARDFITFVLQDHAPSPDPAAHPYLYTHHPNLGPRILSMVSQRLGLDLENQMFLNILLSGLGLIAAFLGFRRAVAPEFALGCLFFLAASYTTFLPNAVDLTRSFHYLLFFLTFYVISRTHDLSRRRWNAALAMLMAVCALGDYASFVVTSSFAIAWLTYVNQRVMVRRILLLIVAPSTLALACYLSVVWAAVGTDFFLFDLAVTYLGRSGQFVGSLYEKMLGHTSALDIAEAYRNHNVVLWARAVQAWGLGDAYRAYAGALKKEVGPLDSLIRAGILGASSLFLVRLRYGLTTALAITVIASLSWSKSVAPVVLLLAVGTVVTAMTAPAAPPSRKPGQRNDVWAWLGSPDLTDASAFLVVTVLAVLAMVAVFPEYSINFLVGERRPPMPLIEMSATGCLAVGLGRALSVLRDSEWPRRRDVTIALSTAGVAVIALYMSVNVRAYKRNPPMPPPYAAMLSRPPYRGASFLTSTSSGVVWYYTRGWTVMSDTANPPRTRFRDNVNLRHFADWKDYEKYARPDFYLCDNSRFRGYEIELPHQLSCTTTRTCDCRDVAQYMESLGYTTTFTSKEYSISALHGGGALH